MFKLLLTSGETRLRRAPDIEAHCKHCLNGIHESTVNNAYHEIIPRRFRPSQQRSYDSWVAVRIMGPISS